MPVSLADPLAVTVNGQSVSLPQVSTGDNDSLYRSSDGNISVEASHTYGKRNRHSLRINITKIAADTFRPDENVARSCSVYFVIDVPDAGFSLPELADYFSALTALASASSNKVLLQVVGGEH
jgi:hypothetical protein